MTANFSPDKCYRFFQENDAKLEHFYAKYQGYDEIFAEYKSSFARLKKRSVKLFADRDSLLFLGDTADFIEVFSLDSYAGFRDKYIESYLSISRRNSCLRSNHRVPDSIFIYMGDVLNPCLLRNILDVGAYRDDTSLMFSKVVGESGTVYAIDASEENLAILKKNNVGAENIKYFWKTFYSRNQTLSVEEDRGGQYILSNARINRDFYSFTEKKMRLETDTVDNFVAKQGISSVDLMKFDIEGSEYYALQGAENTLNQGNSAVSVAIYHHSEHICQIPEYLASFEFDLFYRQIWYDKFFVLPWAECKIIAVPKGKHGIETC